MSIMAVSVLHEHENGLWLRDSNAEMNMEMVSMDTDMDTSKFLYCYLKTCRALD